MPSTDGDLRSFVPFFSPFILLFIEPKNGIFDRCFIHYRSFSLLLSHNKKLKEEREKEVSVNEEICHKIPFLSFSIERESERESKC